MTKILYSQITEILVGWNSKKVVFWRHTHIMAGWKKKHDFNFTTSCFLISGQSSIFLVFAFLPALGLGSCSGYPYFFIFNYATLTLLTSTWSVLNIGPILGTCIGHFYYLHIATWPTWPLFIQPRKHMTSKYKRSSYRLTFCYPQYLPSQSPLYSIILKLQETSIHLIISTYNSMKIVPSQVLMSESNAFIPCVSPSFGTFCCCCQAKAFCKQESANFTVPLYHCL